MYRCSFFTGQLLLSRRALSLCYRFSVFEFAKLTQKDEKWRATASRRTGIMLIFVSAYVAGGEGGIVLHRMPGIRGGLAAESGRVG